MTAPSDLRQLPYSRFYPEDVETGYRDLWGFAYPFHLGDPAAEYNALRTGCALMDYSMLYRWEVHGTGAIATVDAVFSRHVEALDNGQIAYGVFVDDQGMMVDDVTVFRLADDRVLVIGGNLDANTTILNDAATDGVTVTQRRDETAQISIQGPASREILQSMTTADVSTSGLPYYHFLSNTEIGGVTGQLNRMGFTAELGFEFICGIDDAATFGAALLEAADGHNVKWAGLTTMMPARLVAGMIMADLEYDHTSTPFECRLGWTIDFEKGPFRGRDALLAAKDTAPDRVVTVVVDGSDNVIMAPVLANGVEVGVVTRAVTSPSFDITVGLARLRKDAAKVGTELTSANSDHAFTATVVKTPMYDPERSRVRS